MPRLKNRADTSLRRSRLRDRVDQPKRLERREPGYADEDDYADAVRALVADSRQHTDTVNDEARRSMEYYQGKVDYDRGTDPFSLEEEEDDGRSNVVMTVTRDVVDTLLPQLMRIFMTSPDAVVFDPRTDKDSAYARMQTQYCNHVFLQQNDGFSVLHDGIKDALQVKRGVWKHTLEETVRVREQPYAGVTEADMEAIKAMGDVTFSDREEMGMSVPDPTDPFGLAEMTYRVTATIRVRSRRINIVAVPPEEFISHSTSRDGATSICMAHDRMVSRSDLVSLGFDKDAVYDLPAEQSDSADGENQRRQRTGYNEEDTAVVDVSQERVRYVEAYVRLDRDGDGVAELRRCCMAGADLTVLEDGVWEDNPFTVVNVYRIAHSLIGESVGDQTFDLQDVSTALMRSVLDNLAYTNVPRIGYIENQVEPDDIADHRPGAGIRMRQQGAIQPINIPFSAGGTLPFLEYFEGKQEMRTGVSRQSVGLDADALQSSTEVGVRAVTGAAQLKPEMIARLVAQTAVVPMFRAIARLAQRHFDEGEQVYLDGAFHQIDFSQFDPDFNTTVNVGLGSGQPEVKVSMLGQLAAKLEASFQLMGPVNNPFGSPENLRAIYEDMMKLAGIRNLARYLPPGADERMQAWQAAQAEKPDPEMAKAQAKIQMDQQASEHAMAMAQQKMQMETQLAQMREGAAAQLAQAAAAAQLELQQAKQKFETQMQQMRMENDAALATARVDHEALINTMKVSHALRMEEIKLDGQIRLNEIRLGAEIELERRAVAAKTQDGQGNIPND